MIPCTTYFSSTLKLLLLAITVNLPWVFSSSSSSSLRRLSEDLTSIYFIGDLHADVDCAKQWVAKTNLVNLTSSPYEWLGDPETDALVFLGDYVDKGSSSASVLSFVRELQETFPNNVVTILGNHDVFMILDTALSFSKSNPHPLGFPFYEYAYSFVHPEEYLESNFTAIRDDDEEILGAILSALSYVYDKGMQGSVHLCAPNCGDGQVDLFANNIPPFVIDDDDDDTNNNNKNNDVLLLREKAVTRLDTWRKEYARGLFDSGLLEWMASQPLVAIVGDALVVHGGVSGKVMNYMARVSQMSSISVAEALEYTTNAPFGEFFREELANVDGANQIENRFPKDQYTLQLVLDMVQHRGYFKKGMGCSEVSTVLNTLDADLNRIVVGHTPHKYGTYVEHGRLLLFLSLKQRLALTYFCVCVCVAFGIR